SGLLCLIVIVSCSDSPTDPADNNQENTVSDIDGNVYKTVKIGNQWWMAENLKVTHYSNGDSIPNVTDNTQWTGLNTGAYCNYNNDSTNVPTYGRLYNWYAVDDSRGIAPAGWHVPSDDEWKELEMYLGMSQSDANDLGWRGSLVGGKLKEAGTTHWSSPNKGATNESGFTALPGGYRGNLDGSFHYVGSYCYWWSATEEYSGNAWYRSLSCSSSDVGRGYVIKQGGISVRCVRD
ncbi:MAG: fibrobacter succinogenes major paralogous domain-containing protein, partial [Anaerolineaceae bacterium]|nr:fibrobacter succinogenes major paralogous domain-containing protein [Anaerolineaceae bacterium]